jgi:hypothetical protein
MPSNFGCYTRGSPEPSGIKERKSARNSVVTYRNSDVNAARAEEKTG